MPIRCPNCGRDNRDTANWCAGCGQQGLQQLVAQPVSSSSSANRVQVLQPRQTPVQQVATPLIPQPHPMPVMPSPVAVTPQTPVVQSAKQRQALLNGTIETYNENDVYPLRNIRWLLTKIGLGAVVLPFVLSYVMRLSLFAMIIFIVLAVGALVVLGALGGVMRIVGTFVKFLMPRSKPEQKRLTQVSLGVEDAYQTLHRVVLYGDHVGGMLRKGDIVAVYGKRRRSGVIRARRIVVVGREFARGQVQTIAIRSKLSFPPPIVPLLVWLGAVVAWASIFAPHLLPKHP
ncbi:MAG: hypothetical protein H0X37_06435 [Herpetosiphonaceae bacterium]|nr:hypothetical protein [Herpetosiphonaceae bacterium]